MSDLDTFIVIGTVAGGWMFVFAFGNRIQDWYNDRKERKQHELGKIE